MFGISYLLILSNLQRQFSFASYARKIERHAVNRLFSPLFRCFLYFLYVGGLPESHSVFRKCCVVMTGCDAAGVGTVTHTQHTHKDSIVWPQTSAYLYSLPLPYFAHHNARCSKCACVCVCVYTVALLMYSTAQCVQIILANNFLFPVSDSATSCPLSHMDSCPKKT